MAVSRLDPCGGGLRLIQKPTLVISGQYDEATPKVAGALHQGIAHSEWELMADCSHLCHLEQTDIYLERVNTLLDKLESSQQEYPRSNRSEVHGGDDCFDLTPG